MKDCRGLRGSELKACRRKEFKEKIITIRMYKGAPDQVTGLPRGYGVKVIEKDEIGFVRSYDLTPKLKIRKRYEKEPLPIHWRKNAKNSYSGVSPNKKYDFNIRKERGFWILDIFDHKIKDPSEAFMESIELSELKTAKTEAEGWI